MLIERGHVVSQLPRNARDKFACIAHISTASREEEAGSETLLVEASTGHGARNCRLPRTGQAVQPEDARRVLPISPVIYVSKKVDAGIKEAGRVVLPLICVERRVHSSREGAKHIMQIFLVP